MATILPFETGSPRYRFGTTLGDYEVWFDVRFNSRDGEIDPVTGLARGAWYFDLRDDNEKTVIIAGVKIVLGVNLGRHCAHPLFRSNILRAFDTTKSGREATLDDMGSRVVVMHMTLAEILEAS